jgi:hypothetical protein
MRRLPGECGGNVVILLQLLLRSSKQIGYGLKWRFFGGALRHKIHTERLAFGTLKCNGATKANTEILPFDCAQGRMTTRVGDDGEILIRCGLFG